MKYSGSIYEEAHNKGYGVIVHRWTAEIRVNGIRHRRRFKLKRKAQVWLLNTMRELHVMPLRKNHT